MHTLKNGPTSAGHSASVAAATPARRTRNAPRVGLDERGSPLRTETRGAQDAETVRKAHAVCIPECPFRESSLAPISEDAQRALVWNIAALHETEQAREAFSDPDWTEAELAVGYGK